ncbi:hypothetical protein LUZ60_010257 [Juncus effusus]|nr:hypothetical protein LUZ60_010257 [Juncus effusus]
MSRQNGKHKSDKETEPQLNPSSLNGASIPNEESLKQETLKEKNNNSRQEEKERQNDNELKDLFFGDEFDDEDEDEEDGDWGPSGEDSSFILEKWFCFNCTVPNYGKMDICEVCGEQKATEVSGYKAFQDAINRYNASPASVDKSTAFGFDERMLLHNEIEMKSYPHPERPDRLRAIAADLAANEIFPARCTLIPPREITREELQAVHSLDNIEAVEQTKNMFYSYFTADTYGNRDSACAAKLAAGLCADLASSIISGRFLNGFALVRPPGHHATIKQAMGFCLHNNAAVAALAAQRAGAKKILIVDWDVHHGNGTQEIFDGNKSVLYISLHRHEGGNFYPGTGSAFEVGSEGAEGFSVNIPWSCGGVGDHDYVFAFENIVLPIGREFGADLTIISAGFDAARGDPLGGCDVTPVGYARMAQMLTSLSDGKLLVILEGGYNLRSISSSATAVVKVLLGEEPDFNPSKGMPTKEVMETVLQVLQIQSQFWPVLTKYYSIVKPLVKFFSSNNGSLKKRQYSGPFWWNCGSKRLLFELIHKRLQKKRLRHTT